MQAEIDFKLGVVLLPLGMQRQYAEALLHLPLAICMQVWFNLGHHVVIPLQGNSSADGTHPHGLLGRSFLSQRGLSQRRESSVCSVPVCLALALSHSPSLSLCLCHYLSVLYVCLSLLSRQSFDYASAVHQHLSLPLIICLLVWVSVC